MVDALRSNRCFYDDACEQLNKLYFLAPKLKSNFVGCGTTAQLDCSVFIWSTTPNEVSKGLPIPMPFEVQRLNDIMNAGAPHPSKLLSSLNTETEESINYKADDSLSWCGSECASEETDAIAESQLQKVLSQHVFSLRQPKLLEPFLMASSSEVFGLPDQSKELTEGFIPIDTSTSNQRYQREIDACRQQFSPDCAPYQV